MTSERDAAAYKAQELTEQLDAFAGEGITLMVQAEQFLRQVQNRIDLEEQQIGKFAKMKALLQERL